MAEIRKRSVRQVKTARSSPLPNMPEITPPQKPVMRRTNAFQLLQLVIANSVVLVRSLFSKKVAAPKPIHRLCFTQFVSWGLLR